MPSLFYTAAFDRRFQLPFLLLEDIGIAADGFGDDPTEDDVSAAIKHSLKRCFPGMKAGAADIAYVAERLEKLAEEKVAKEEEKPSKKQGFAVSFAAWAGKLKPCEMCLIAANYDYFLAKRLYAEVDREDVMEMSAQWMAREWENVKVNYEAVVYGFGGGYKEGSADSVVDVSTDDNTNGKVINAAALASVKF